MRREAVDSRHHAHGVCEIVESDMVKCYAHACRRCRGRRRRGIRIHHHAHAAALDDSVFYLYSHVGKNDRGRRQGKAVGGESEEHGRIGRSHAIPGIAYFGNGDVGPAHQYRQHVDFGM